MRLQKHILRLLAKLQQQYGLSMLIISHDLDVIAALSQRMLVLQQGQVVEQGEVAAIFAKPSACLYPNFAQTQINLFDARNTALRCWKLYGARLRCRE